MPNVVNQGYRPLTEAEIAALKDHANSADDWAQVWVKEDFVPKYILNTHFSGWVRLGLFEKTFDLPGGISKHSGLYYTYLHNVEVGDNCCIEHVNNYIANYTIGEETFISNVDTILVQGETTFGNGVEVSVLNETGGREVLSYDQLSAHEAYFMAMYRHRPEFIQRLRQLIISYIDGLRSSHGTIGAHAHITDVGNITNVKIGDYAEIVGTRRLYNGSVNSVREAPVTLGYSVICTDFIISSGSRVESGTALSRCFVGQACTLAHGYSASDSLFFSNCHGENGEACAIFAGPFTVTHHKSTLLIASQFSFMNAGSGSNQSNHMYKLGPIHQGIMERGAKTSSDSYILWPARIGAFSLVMGRHTTHPDLANLPFSYLIESCDKTFLIPGVNLKSVGTIRDAQKWPRRDARTDPHHLDQINYNLLSPYTIQKMINGRQILEELQRVAGMTSEIYSYQSAKIKASSLRKGIHYYDLAIHKFLGNSLIKRLEGLACTSIEAVRSALRPTTTIGLGDWVDLSGLLAPKAEVLRLVEAIESGAIHEVGEIHETLTDLHRRYYEYEWTWAYDKIKTYYGLDLEGATASEIAQLVERWRSSVVELDREVYADAKKEFSLSAMTGFGADGDEVQQARDFEEVRGAFDSNPYVSSILKHIEDKSALGQELLDRLAPLL
ncbi:DUF4954 family protein [Porphyromonas sp. oral taxon 278]|jgi:hypothetical protein|uniref:DUF4954 family protein n=1 Tax=Porphyromonas sp. oral taxon 278 TaxID=712437 RepID=UPI000411C2CE|nr:DUF4954 family protein [Porphyromonas sp. oral taxon 278]